MCLPQSAFSTYLLCPLCRAPFSEMILSLDAFLLSSPAVGEYGLPALHSWIHHHICACVCVSRLFSISGWAWGSGYQCMSRPVWQKGPLVGNLGSRTHNQPGQNILRTELSSASFPTRPRSLHHSFHRSQTRTVVRKPSWPTPARCPLSSQANSQ